MNKIDLNKHSSLSFDHGTILLKGAVRNQLPINSESSIWMWDTRVGSWRCDAIYYPAVSKTLSEQFGQNLSDEVMKPQSVTFSKIDLPELRPEQEDALTFWNRSGCRGQIIMPTGTGKTIVALAAMARTKTATLIVAPVRDLMYQWHRRILHAFDYDSGIVGDGLSNIKPVTVTTYDSAYIHMAKMGAGFGLLIFDEEHHLPGKYRREAAILSTAPMRLGLTATPQRSDDLHKDLDWLIGPVVYDMPFHHAKGSTLADFDVVRIPVALTDSEQATYDQCAKMIQHYIISRRREVPGYDWQDLCKESGKDPQARHVQKAYYLKQSIENRASEKLRVLEDIFRLHKGQQILVFAGSNRMAIEVSCRFLVPTILSHTRKRERLEVLEEALLGRLVVVRGDDQGGVGPALGGPASAGRICKWEIRGSRCQSGSG